MWCEKKIHNILSHCFFLYPFTGTNVLVAPWRISWWLSGAAKSSNDNKSYISKLIIFTTLVLLYDNLSKLKP